MTREEFEKLLDEHDWHYQRSDDPHAYHAGVDSMDNIRAAIRAHPEWLPLYNLRNARAHGHA